jgi:O-antigen ligase
LKVLAVFGLAEAILGLVQHFIAPGWIFGYLNTTFRVTGTLINRNHYAGLLEMFVPVAFGAAYLAASRRELARAYIYLLAAALMGIALLLSASRTGIFSFLVTLSFLGLLVQVQKTHRKLALALPLTVIVLVMAGAVWIGIDVAVQRYSDLFGEEAILREGRLSVYRDAIQLIAANPLGVGVGNFQDRYRKYQSYRPDLLFDHAHNDYLETAAEWGMPIAICFWTFVGFAFVQAVRSFIDARSPERRSILLACIGAIFAILVHSLTDFNLQIPSNAMLFSSFVGIALASPDEIHLRA